MTVEAVKEAISGKKQLTVLIGRKLGPFSKYKHHQTKVPYRDSVKFTLRLYPSRPGCLVRNNLILDRLEAVCGYTVKILVSSVRAAIGKYRGTEDTNEAFHSGKHECIRLGGIDFSEKGQAYGNNAKHAASELAFGKDVTIQTHGHDKYRRAIGDMILPDGMNLNHALVKES